MRVSRTLDRQTQAWKWRAEKMINIKFALLSLAVLVSGDASKKPVSTAGKIKLSGSLISVDKIKKEIKLKSDKGEILTKPVFPSATAQLSALRPGHRILVFERQSNGTVLVTD